MLGSKDKECSFLRKILVVVPSMFCESLHTEKFVYFLLNHFLLIFVVVFRGGFPQIKILAIRRLGKGHCKNFYNWKILPM